MNDMRKLMEALEDIDDIDVATDIHGEPMQDETDKIKALEYAAFVYGAEWGNSAQYEGGGYDRDELPAAYKEWVDSGRKGLYEDTVIENIGSSESEGGPYTAAKLYLSHPGLVKPALAKELSEQTGIDYDIAVLMIDAIDAYEDIRESFDNEIQ